MLIKKMNKSSICNCCTIACNNTRVVYIQECAICHSCAKEHGWRECNDCPELLHPDDQFIYEGDCFCEKCFNNCFSTYQDNFDHRDLHVCDSYVHIHSNRHYGIELETSKCPRYQLLQHEDCWGAKHDSTISGKEFCSPKMRGDCGFDAIKDICKLATANEWSVNKRCGYHLHVDVSQESARSLRAIAYAYNHTIDIWKTFVNKCRVRNPWCTHSCEEDYCFNLKSKSAWQDFSNYDAYRDQWINWRAYIDHGTVEVRSHEGTLDVLEICNWVRAHTAFVDWGVAAGPTVVKKTLQGGAFELFEKLAQIWVDAGEEDLLEYYASKSTLNLESMYELV